jgi:hypothetical protein
LNDPKVFEHPCAICRKREATQLCDYVIGYNNSIIFIRDYKKFIEENSACKHETCDLPICKECAKNAGHNLDFCPHHYELYLQKELPEHLKKAQLREKARQFSSMN